MFPVRWVRGAKRRREYATCDGTRIAPADNSPAWAVHTALMQRRLSSYAQFRKFMLEIPTHMFDVKRIVGPTANDDGYYFAHLFPAKNGDTDFRAWRRPGVERQCYRALHPCNFFLVPGGRAQGEDQQLISFVASMYRKRHSAIWSGFLTCIGETEASVGPTNPQMSFTPRARAIPARRYQYGRLCFKRDVIEPLTENQVFEVATPMGTYRFTKRQFYATFPKIPLTQSFRERGVYHGAKLHLKAEHFRVPDRQQCRQPGVLAQPPELL
ncbi:MAG: hypothetical protein ACRD01_03305 [Terriglobales bacterium]